MILELDIGNTRLKWRIKSEGMVVTKGAFNTDEISVVFEGWVGHYSPSRVLVASVVPSIHDALNSLCLKHWGLSPEYATVTRECNGLKNAYEDVSEMGVDRWLGMLAAFQQYPGALLVISAGSALTIDLLLSDGRHLGGFITPGLQLMRRSLYRDTDQVKLNDIYYDGELLGGRSTRQAVCAGLALMQIGIVQQALNILRAEEVSPRLVITGGDAEYLSDALQKRRSELSFESVFIEPDLIFEGLAILFEQKEKSICD